MKIYTSHYYNKPLEKDDSIIKIAISTKIFDNIASKINIHEPSFAPSYSIWMDHKNDHDDEKYVNRFKSEIIPKINFGEKLKEWEKLGKDIALLCYKKPEEFCHRQIIAEILENDYGYDIKEYGYESMIRKDYKMVDIYSKEFKEETAKETVKKTYDKKETPVEKLSLKPDFKKKDGKFYLAITGHANIEKALRQKNVSSGYDENVYKKFELDIQLMIKNLCDYKKIDEKDLVLISGMARGVDEIFAIYAMEHNLDLILAVPNSVSWHKNRDPRHDGTKAQAERYDEILNYVKLKQNGISGIYEIRKMYQGKEYQYANFARNDFMVNNCNGIVSHKIDKSPGTTHAINSAIHNGKHLGNIYSYDGLKTLKEHFSNLSIGENNLDDTNDTSKVFSIQYNTDLFTFSTHVLIHGCNCFNTMGAGVASIIKDNYPEMFAADDVTLKGDRNKMGTFTYAKINGGDEKTKPVYGVNLYSQYTFYDKNDMFDIKAFKNGMYSVLNHFIKERNDKGKKDKVIKFSFPAIGLGLANGKIEEIYSVLKKIEKDFKKDNVSLSLCLHPKDKELNKKFKELENDKSKHVGVEL